MYQYKYPRAAVTVDIIILDKKENTILLIKRKNDPFKNKWALPGGFMEMNETLEQTAERELVEETNLNNIKLKQFHTFSALNRDPRHRTVTAVYYGFVDSSKIKVKAGDDAKETKWFHINKLPELAFDHNFVIERFKNDVLYFNK